MEEKILHDPRTKQQLKDLLYGFLYGPLEKHFKTRLDTLIMRNSSMCGNTHPAFSYQGNIYSIDERHQARKINRLNPALHTAMQEYLKEVTHLNNKEMPYVIGFINQTLNSTNSLQDYLRVLPDSVHSPIVRLIDTCPCKECLLSNEAVEALKTRNADSITLMKRRMLTNLLI